MPCKVTLLCALAGLVAFVGLITGLVMLGESFHRTDEHTTCIEWDAYSGEVNPVPITEAIHGMFGPYARFECLPTTLESLSFRDGGEGAYRAIKARSRSGLKVKIFVDVEYRYKPEHVELILLQSDKDSEGNIDPRHHFAIAARSSLRNAVSNFDAKEFLRGSRPAIAEQMKVLLQAAYDPLYGVVNRVNILEINFDEDFETAFGAVEQTVLAKRKAEEDAKIYEINEQRLEEQEVIAALAERDRQLQEAQIRLTEAELKHTADITRQRTETERAIIKLETERGVALIRERALVDEARAEMDIFVQEALRQRRTDLEVAATDRTSTKAQYAGKIKTANATRTQRILQATIDARTTMETLEVSKINHALGVYRERLGSNVTVARVTEEGKTAAERRLAALKPVVQRDQGLIDELGLSPAQATRVVWYGKMAGNKDAVRFGDYAKVPLLMEEAKGGVGVAASTHGRVLGAAGEGEQPAASVSAMAA